MNYKSPKVKAWGIVGLAIASIIFVLIATLSLTSERSITGRYEDFFVSKEEYKEIKKDRTEAKLISTPKITFDGQAPYIDEDNTLYYSLIEGSDSAHNPKISLKVADYNYHLAIKETPLSDDNIRHNTEFKFLIYNKDSYQVLTMHATTLPILSIEYDEESAAEKSAAKNPDSLKESGSDLIREVDTEISLSLFDNRKDIKNRTIESKGVFHPRGAVSYSHPKQSYKLSLKTAENNSECNDLSLLGLREDDDYILNGSYFDPEKIRTIFEMNLWTEASGKQNSLGITNGVEYRYVEVFENKQYWGLYQLGFPIDEKQLNLAKSNDGLYSESLFKKILWDNSRDYSSSVPNDWELKNSTEDNIAAWNELLTYEKLLKNPSSNANAIRNQTDMLSAIDLSLFINFTQNYDISYDKDNLYNAYLSFHNNDGQRVALYTPWDVDLSFGHYIASDSIAETTYLYEPTKNVDETLTPAHALQRAGDKTINQELIARYHELRNTYWSEKHIDELLDKYQNEIYNSGAFRRDLVRWPNGRHNDEDERLDFFRNYVHERLFYMDQYILDLENGKYDYAE